ncbi:MAG: hypothetical protein KME03_01290 [Aphanocapsa lilacina HA4352-LM1]|nr:hypothetical protein [Aphanocapsa lilacina HA4352-LM1]
MNRGLDLDGVSLLIALGCIELDPDRARTLFKRICRRTDMLKVRRMLCGLLLACVWAGGASAQMAEPAQPVSVKTVQAAGGAVLTDSEGKTLYVFDRDGAGKSNCNDKCAQNWPPLPAQADAKSVGKYTVVTRDDGSRQWAYDGKPLYRWVKDQKPGDATGDGIGGVWHTARP